MISESDFSFSQLCMVSKTFERGVVSVFCCMRGRKNGARGMAEKSDDQGYGSDMNCKRTQR